MKVHVLDRMVIKYTCIDYCSACTCTCIYHSIVLTLNYYFNCKELSNPILYLDIMRWAWEQDYHNRPSAVELESVLEQSAIPHLVDAYSMKGNSYQKVLSSDYCWFTIHVYYYKCTLYMFVCFTCSM